MDDLDEMDSGEWVIDPDAVLDGYKHSDPTLDDMSLQEEGYFDLDWDSIKGYDDDLTS